MNADLGGVRAASGAPRGRAPIRRLLPQVADAIAAGEVVERPAAVVKELCENALDAGATRIEVVVEGGGLVRIAVEDDGAGIPGDELPLAVARHATSKLSTVTELAAVRSLGFRGEALASIAAVSDLRLVSRTARSEVGHLIRCRAGEVIERRAAPCAPGTRAEARDLFHNTPARLAFLRAERGEVAACVKAVSDLALTHPEVSFLCRIGDRISLRTPGGTLREAAAAVFGRDAGELLAVDAPGEIDVAGLISEPRRHRGTRAGLLLVVNRRPVRSSVLAVAVEEAYSGLLPTGRHPFGVVAVSLDPEAVDVNVHPTKREVRLRQEGRVFAAVQRACWAALQDTRLSAAAHRLPQLGRAPVPEQPLPLELREAPEEPGGPEEPRGRAASGMPRPRLAGGWPASGAVPARAAGPEGRTIASGAGDHRLGDLDPLTPLAQSADGWLVAESPRGICLVDPHAAHEKVLYVELLDQSRGASSGGGTAPSQALLFEATLSVDAADAERVAESHELLAGMGFELDPFGPGLVRCRAVPAAAGGRDPERLLRQIVDGLRAGGDDAARRHRLAALTACHAATRLGDRLDPREQARLLARLVETPGGLTCPHGRPTVLVLDDASLRRAFGRPAV